VAESGPYKGLLMKILLCSQARTGSNMLRSIIGQHPDIRVGGECCEDGHLQLWWSAWSSEPMPTLPAVANPQKHIEYLWKCLDMWNVHDGHAGNVFHKAAALESDVKVLWLSRRNKIDQAISLVLAHKTNIWIPNHSVDKTDKVQLNPEDIASLIRDFNKGRQHCKKLLKNHPGLDIEYEQLCSDLSTVLSQLWSFLGVSAIIAESETKKTYRQSVSEIVINYDDIVRYVRSGMGCCA
jgi:hypothetical protein